MPPLLEGFMPTPRYCVLIAEIDGTELEFSEELGLDADKVYFTGVGYTADNAQDAIVETIGLSGTSRTPYPFSYSGNTGAPRYLDVTSGIGSDNSPHIAPEDGTFEAIGLSTDGLRTGDVEVYINGTTAYTINYVNQDAFNVSGLDIPIMAGDKISARVVSGSLRKPNLQIHVKVTP